MADGIARGGTAAGSAASAFWPKFSLLGGLPETSRRRMLELGAERRFERGRRILEEGEISTFVVLLRAGFVKVSARLDDGRQALLAIRTRGDLVGELAAIDDHPRSGTVTACSPVEATIIAQGEFLGYLSRHPQANLQFNRMLAYRLRQANRRRLDFTGCTAPVRVSRVLTELIETYGRRTPRGWVCDVPFTQHELADLSGTSVETAQITLRGLRNAGVLNTGYRKLTVLDSRALHDAAHLTP
ncbi:Crp/Fnr family transcriptional regulator [Spirillospora sp. NPDC048824]|uniref:Crp/Fnr family transcriptional regulator n=1 Tax=Spirillospora sp. NPDC048824 TaxID=3364526 RepID=UPI003712EAF3